MTSLCLLALLALFTGQFVLARTTPEPLRSILRVQAVYWFLAYVLRPVILVLVSPAPVVNDSLADDRLAYGGYDAHLPAVLMPVIVGHAVYLLLVLLVGPRLPHLRSLQASPALVLVLFAILLGARLAWMSGVHSAVVASLLTLAPVVVALMLFPAHPPRRLALLVALLVLTEVSWSVIFASKTPILSLFVCLVLVAASRGWRPRRGHLVVGVVALPGLVLGFSVLQSVKHDSTVTSDLQVVDQRYPTLVRPLLPLARRFDLLAAVTDSTYAQGRWISAGEVARRAATSLVPRAVADDKTHSAGERWAIEVRSLSRNSVPGVSLAEGPVAEGNAVAGLSGVVAECAFLAVVTLACAAALARGGTFVFALACCLVLQPAIQERGVLGIADVTGKGLQIALVVAAASLLFGGVHRVRNRCASAEAHRPHAGTPARLGIAGDR
ncbi:hypothetical protein [Actinopolymorpha pittospori]